MMMMKISVVQTLSTIMINIVVLQINIGTGLSVFWHLQNLSIWTVRKFQIKVIVWVVLLVIYLQDYVVLMESIMLMESVLPFQWLIVINMMVLFVQNVLQIWPLLIDVVMENIMNSHLMIVKLLELIGTYIIYILKL